MNINDFNLLVNKAISELPDEFKEKLRNISIFIKNLPKMNKNGNNGMLLGLYEGVPNPHKGAYYTFILPDKITLYKNNIEIIADYKNIRIEDVIKAVLYHEVGHHFGFSEEDLSSYNIF